MSIIQKGQTAIFILLIIVVAGFIGIIYFAVDQGSKLRIQDPSETLSVAPDSLVNSVPVGDTEAASWTILKLNNIKLEIPRALMSVKGINDSFIRVSDQILSTFKFLK